MRTCLLLLFLAACSPLSPSHTAPLHLCYHGEKVTVVSESPMNVDEWLVRFDERFVPFYWGKEFNLPKGEVRPCEDDPFSAARRAV